MIGVRDQECPCGSDRTYRECCGRPEKVVPLAQARWRRAALSLRGRLSAFAEETDFVKEATEAQEVYFSQIDEEILALDEEFLIERCFEWFIFDYRLPGNRTILDLYRERYGLRLPLMEALLLVQWGESRGSLYEIKGVLPRRGLILDDLFSGERFKVREPGLQAAVIPGSVVHVRLLKVGSEYEFSTSAVGVPPAYRERLREWVGDDYRRWRCGLRRGEDTIQEYLRRQGHRLNAQVIRMGLGTEVRPPRKPVRRPRPAERLVSLLQDDVLRRVCRTREGREQVEELLGMIRRIERDTRPASPPPGPECAMVAEQVARGLADLGFGREMVQSALRFWYDYCAQVHPRIKSPEAWTAAMIYGTARLDRGRAVSQAGLARRYGAAPSTVSHHFRLLAEFLSPARKRTGGWDEGGRSGGIEPLVDRILANLNL